MALGQVRGLVRELGVQPVVQADTAGAAGLVAGWGRPEDAAIASALAAEMHGLVVLRGNVEDEAHNTTRFYITATFAGRAPRRRPGADDDVRVRGAQRAGGALQGAGRVRDEWRET